MIIGRFSVSWDRDPKQDYLFNLRINIPASDPTPSFDDHFEFGLRVRRLIVGYIPRPRESDRTLQEAVHG